MKVLICEDEEMLLTALEFRLRKQGVTVLTATDGQQALALVKSEQPDLLVTDIDTPKLDGIALSTKIRETGSTMPILIVGPLDQSEHIMEAIKAGANDFLAKPCKPDELILRIKLQHLPVAETV